MRLAEGIKKKKYAIYRQSEEICGKGKENKVNTQGKGGKMKLNKNAKEKRGKRKGNIRR